MIKMKALRSFGTKKSNEGHVRRGREFEVATDGRAKELEAIGFAYRLGAKVDTAPLNKMEPRPSNKAAGAGPLPSVGGKTGADAPAPSSPPDPPRRGRRSARSNNEDLL